MSNDIIPVIILIGRPASGKSEIIDYLSRLEAGERRRRFHLGNLEVIDDFPMLWAWFEEDEILVKKLGRARLHTDENGNFIHHDLWHLLVERVGLEYQKLLRDHPDYHAQTTTLVEFSRGGEHGGYRAALPHLPAELLRQAGVVYVRVSFAEALRKNRRRYNPNRPDSILEHGLSDEKLTHLYREDDWDMLAAGHPTFIRVGEVQVPYVVFENEDDVTTDRTERLGERLQEVLGRLRALRNV